MNPQIRIRRRGAAQVEGVVALLPLMAVMFGVLDFGVAILVKNTMQMAVRQGVRYAVTSRTLPGMGHDASIRDVVRTHSLGLLDCLAPDGHGSDRIRVEYFDPVTLNPVSGSGSNAGGNIVVVTAEGVSWAWLVPLLRDAAPLTFSVSSADIMEATPIAGVPDR